MASANSPNNTSPRLNLEQASRQTLVLVRSVRLGDLTAAERFRAALPEKPAIKVSDHSIQDAQRVIAYEHGFESWIQLLQSVHEAERPSKFLAIDHPFVAALRDLDLERVREQLAKDSSLVDMKVLGDYSLTGMDWKAPVDDDFPGYMGPLHFAAFHGHVALAKLLVERGACVNDIGMDFRNNDGPTTAASLAAWEGGADVLRVILEAGKKADVQMDLTDALSTAASHSNQPVVEILLKHGASHDIYTASMMGDLEAIKELLDENPALVNQEEPRWGKLPIQEALNCGQLETAELLAKRGAELSPMAAAGLGRVESVKAAVEEDGKAATTLLSWAIKGRQIDVVRFLLEYGANPEGPDPDDWTTTPLMMAIGTEEECNPIVELLIKAGANVNRMSCGHTLLGNALGNDQIVRAMINAGADVDLASHNGNTPLHYAVNAIPTSVLEIVRLLLESGADPVVRNKDGQTPVDIAIERELYDVVEFLEEKAR